MLSVNNFFDHIVILFFYLFIYNISLLSLFWTLQQIILNNFKSLYSFSDFKFNFFFTLTLTIVLLSIAGVPPFLGFFPKILILILLINSNFFFFFFFFFVLLFFGLYFYIQNIRFIHTSSSTKINYSHDLSIRISFSYYFWQIFLLFILVIGPLFFDDILIFFYWIFS